MGRKLNRQTDLLCQNMLSIKKECMHLHINKANMFCNSNIIMVEVRDQNKISTV